MVHVGKYTMDAMGMEYLPTLGLNWWEMKVSI